MLALSLLAYSPASTAMDAASYARGGDLTKSCVSCHGADGNSTSASFPSIAGQGERYLFEQMVAIRDGKRSAPLMANQLSPMSDDDLRDIAVWYSNNEAQTGQADPALLELGQSLYRYGDAKRQIPACSACHGPDGRGLARAALPALSGQYSQYTITALKDYRSGDRRSSVSGAMNHIARRLSDDDIRSLAEFIQGLY